MPTITAFRQKIFVAIFGV